MKLTVKPVLLKLVTLAAGLLGLMLYTVLLESGVDSKGLLAEGFWAGQGLCVLTVAMFILLSLVCLALPRRQQIGSVGIVGGIGAVIAAVLMAISALIEFDTWMLLPSLLPLAAAAVMLVIGICRILGSQPYFLLHAALSVFFAWRMISQYQSWNAAPQLLNYAFYLGANTVLMLHAYQHAAVDIQLGKGRMLWWTGLCAVLLCCISFGGNTDSLSMLGGAIWAFTNLPELKSRSRRFVTPQEEE